MELKALRKPFYITALAITLCVSNAYALPNIKQENVRVTLDRQSKDGVIALVLKAQLKSKPNVNIFTLTNPSRIVLDFEKGKLRHNEQFAVPDSPVVSTIRLGTHPAKFRIVVDIKGDYIPEFKHTQNNELVALTIVEKQLSQKKIRAVANRATEKEQTQPEDPAVKIKKQGKDHFPPTNAVKLLAVRRNKTDQQLSSTPALEPTKVPDMQAAQLNEVAFVTVPEHFVKFILSKKLPFEFVKTDSRTYLLKIANCLLHGDHLLLPQFPPRDFPGITMIKPEYETDHVEIKIATEEDFRLTATARDNEISVQAR